MKLIQSSKNDPSSSRYPLDKGKGIVIDDTPRHFNSNVTHSGNSFSTQLIYWILDIGSIVHICPHKHLFRTYMAISPLQVKLPNGHQVHVHFSGTVVVSATITLHNVLHIPEFAYCLISVHTLTKLMNCALTFSQNSCLIQELPSLRTIGAAKIKNGLYLLKHQHRNIDFSVNSINNDVYVNNDYKFLKVFGCACYPHICPYNTHKLDFHTKECVFLEYSSSHKGYKFLAPDGKIFISKDVIFNEYKFPYMQLFSQKSAASETASPVLPSLFPFELSSNSDLTLPVTAEHSSLHSATSSSHTATESASLNQSAVAASQTASGSGSVLLTTPNTSASSVQESGSSSLSPNGSAQDHENSPMQSENQPND